MFRALPRIRLVARRIRSLSIPGDSPPVLRVLGGSPTMAPVFQPFTTAGEKQSLVVNLPSPVSGTPGTPTGAVFTGQAGFTFKVNDAQAPSLFTFVTEDGTIIAWGPAINPNDLPNDAFIVVDNSANPTPDSGAVYKGVTIAQM